MIELNTFPAFNCIRRSLPHQFITFANLAHSFTLTTPQKLLPSQPVNPSNRAILFFDGDCGFCNRNVRFLIRRDKHKRLYFAPLQGVAAQAIVPLKYRQSLSTIVYHRPIAHNKYSINTRSDAVLLALIDVGGLWRFIAKCIRLLPARFRDGCYDRIANNRKRLSGNTTCKLPTKEEHARILP